VLPWDSSNNGKVLWTSGPHSWSRGGNFQAKIGISRGSGLDFADSVGVCGHDVTPDMEVEMSKLCNQF